MTEIAYVAHFFPGVGDPLDLPVSRFESLLERIVDVREIYEPGDQTASLQRDRDRRLDAGDPQTWEFYE